MSDHGRLNHICLPLTRTIVSVRCICVNKSVPFCINIDMGPLLSGAVSSGKHHLHNVHRSLLIILVYLTLSAAVNSHCRRWLLRVHAKLGVSATELGIWSLLDTSMCMMLYCLMLCDRVLYARASKLRSLAPIVTQLREYYRRNWESATILFPIYIQSLPMCHNMRLSQSIRDTQTLVTRDQVEHRFYR